MRDNKTPRENEIKKVMKMEKQKVLILSPHTDDAELGCGGTISKLIEEGHDIFWVVFSIARESLLEGWPQDSLEKEFSEVIKSLGIGYNNSKILDFQVRKFPEKRQEILEEISKLKREFKPDLLIIPSLNDCHQDHQTVAQEAVRAFKMDSNILCYEMPWNQTNFSTQFFVKLSEGHMNKKLELIEKYKSQIAKNAGYLTKDYIFGLARVRGSQCREKYAEAFEVIRWRF